MFELIKHSYTIITGIIAGASQWVDFDSDAYLDFRRDASNFGDGVHLVPRAAAQVMAKLNALVNDRMAQGQLGPATAQ